MSQCRSPEYRQTFAVEDGWLVRTAHRKDGWSYQHRCGLDAYKAVVYYLDEHADAGVTTNGLWDGLPDVPCTQAATAVRITSSDPPVLNVGIRPAVLQQECVVLVSILRVTCPSEWDGAM